MMILHSSRITMSGMYRTPKPSRGLHREPEPQLMRLQPIVYVTDMTASIDWYGLLLDRQPTVTSDHWTTFTVGDATLALHAGDSALPDGNVALSLVVTGTLEAAADRMNRSDAIDEQPFGRSFTVTDPDGTTIQVNEHRRHLDG